MHVRFGPTESYRQSQNNLSSILEARGSDLDQTVRRIRRNLSILLCLPRKMSKQYFVPGGFITHHPELIIHN